MASSGMRLRRSNLMSSQKRLWAHARLADRSLRDAETNSELLLRDSLQREGFKVTRLDRTSVPPNDDEIAPSNDTPDDDDTRQKSRRSVRTLLLFVIPALAILAGGYLYGLGGRFVSTENAYVRADIITISSEIDGRVSRVHVKNNAQVKAGQLLFELDPRPFELKLAAAESELAIVRHRIGALRAQLRERETEIVAARERIRFLKVAFERRKRLAARGYSAVAQLQEAEHKLRAAEQNLRTLDQRRLMVVAELGGRSDLPIERHPSYQRAIVTRDQAKLDLERTKIRAPTAGVVGKMTLQAGEQVEARDTIFPIIASSAPWVEANLKEVHMSHVREGQDAHVEIDSYPGRIWKAKVASISPATGAEFSLLPAQNATGNWVKVVQRVPVKLRLIIEPDSPPLRSGMTASIEIDTQQKRRVDTLLSYLMPDTGPVTGTDTLHRE